MTARFSLHRHSDGEEFELSIESITETDGDPQLRVSVVDKYAMVYEEDTIVGPSVLEVTEGEEIVIAEENDEENRHRLVSPKLAAIIGGATLTGVSAIAATYFYRQKKK